MSLIGEALKRARQEAAYQEAARDGRTWGPPPVYAAPKRRIWPLVAAGVAAGALLVGGVGGGVYWAVTRDARTAEVAARDTAAVEAPGSVPPGATPVIEELGNPSPSTETPPPEVGAGAAAPSGGLPQNPTPLPVPEEPAVRPLAPAAIPVPRPERSPAPVEISPPVGQPPAATRPAPGAEPTPPAPPTQPDPQAEAPSSASQATPAAPTEPAPTAPAGPAGGEQAAPAPAGEVQTYVGSAPLPDGSRLELTGIAFSQDQPVALINGRVMGVGEGIQGYTLVRIEDGQVELKGRGATLVLRVQ